MKIAIIIVALLIVGGLGWYFLTENSSDTVPTNTVNVANTRVNTNSVVNTPPTTNTAVVNTSSPVNTAPINTSVIDEVQVLITPTGFSPQTVTITAGQSVVWTNTDTAIHTPTPDDHPDHDKYAGIWDDPNDDLRTGETLSQLFLTPGTYTYHDHEDERLTGTIIVQR